MRAKFSSASKRPNTCVKNLSPPSDACAATHPSPYKVANAVDARGRALSAAFQEFTLPGYTALCLFNYLAQAQKDDRLQRFRQTGRAEEESVSSRETHTFNLLDCEHYERPIMKIIVIGGSGRIGSRVVNQLREQGHEAVAASPNSGVNTLSGQGLSEALKGARVVVDVSDSPSWEDAAVMNFFETSTRNILASEAAAGVGHHVALSVVGSDRMVESGYFRAKIAQENLIKGSSVPHSIVRATQFYEFFKGIADFSTDGNKVRVPNVLIQPMAADDVASAVVRTALGAPVNGTIEVGGPEKFRLDEFIRRGLAALKDPREVVADPNARYYGIAVKERTLVPEDGARLGKIRFDDWLADGLKLRSRSAASR
jgi:uncharacterized protein YbjT (DUF2867 family)